MIRDDFNLLCTLNLNGSLSQDWSHDQMINICQACASFHEV